jgi:hypothetical protein
MSIAPQSATQALINFELFIIPPRFIAAIRNVIRLPGKPAVREG